MKKNLETICVQGGWQPKNGEPRVLPIYQSTTFKYSSTEEMADLFDLKAEGYFYTRLANPTNDAVAAKINELEGGVGCVPLRARLPTSMLSSISAKLATISLLPIPSMVERSICLVLL